MRLAFVLIQIFDWCQDFGESFGNCSVSPEALNPFLELLFSSARALKETSNLTNDMAIQLKSVVGDIDSDKTVRKRVFLE